MKLHVAPPSPRAFKVLALANYLGLDYELKPVNLAAGDQLRPEFVAMNPNHRMPVLDDDGFILWESNAIVQYLASKKPESGLLPADPRGRAEVNRWQFWEVSHWDPACAALIWEHTVKKLFGQGDTDPAAVAKAEENFRFFAGVLNGALRGRKFVTGNQLTVADYSIGAWLTCTKLGRYPIGDYKEVLRWHATLEDLPAWKSSIAPIPV